MAGPSDTEELLLGLRGGRLRGLAERLRTGATYALTRFLILRLLGLVYFVAFASAATQVGPLLGPDGLLPAVGFLDRVVAATGSRGEAFTLLPTLFLWITPTDAALRGWCWVGALLSLVALGGATNAILQLALWGMYLSLVKVGQLFYGYGWEIQLLETGFLAIFLCPVRSISPRGVAPPPAVVIWLFRWLIVRIMLGAGLIKLRGDPCWRDLTCLVYHYETQPVPSPLSWLLHQAPRGVHQVGVLFNHLVELVAPFFAFGPRRARLVAGGLFVVFQGTLILSGNLSFLNWLTLVPALACFDDAALARLFPERLRGLVGVLDAEGRAPSRHHRFAAVALAVVVAGLSVEPVANLVSTRQVMNTSFNALSLVNTYGAFGSVGKERFEVVLEGTAGAPDDPEARWLPYELPCKPGDVARRPCLITPWHYRVDWQIWFAAQSVVDRQPWLVHLVAKLLEGDRGVKRLLAHDPFPDTPPRAIRVALYRYEFTRWGEPGFWRRTYLGEYLRPLRRGDPDLTRFLEAHGWADRPRR
ncbi:lipase maturation factor family protein [Chondromyces apiculatus]|uniref:Integral membrane protein n=1 Tax=Chondromyces apiculatus DSM 436 TaxID=1192034 RepID=A0A017T3M4_9BACT|nr:lipase maturation factor family protein [Chondromyces apiculatus]EYF03151.1 integral membrane protein [Chondromyces apiculatus DSM 436]